MICQRCLKTLSAEGVHTCTPTELVRKLEADLVAMTQERDEFERRNSEAVLRNAEGLAREQQLREALKQVKHRLDCNGISGRQLREYRQIDAALSLPQDDTALRQWGAKLLRDLVYNRLEGLCNESGMKELLRKADELEAGK